MNVGACSRRGALRQVHVEGGHIALLLPALRNPKDFFPRSRRPFRPP
jgi:hypothetical protein